MSYPSSLKKDTATEPMELDLFCMTVSSATAHDYIHQRMVDMDKYVFGINKRQQKAKEKAAQAAQGAQG